MRMIVQGFAALVGMFLLAAPVNAQTVQPAADKDSLLHLTETAQRSVPRDRLRVELTADVTDADAGKVQAEINKRMTAAVAKIKAVPDLSVETGGYSVYWEQPDKQSPRWHGRQSVSFTGKDFAAILALTGPLQQQGMVVTTMTPELSREARQAVEDALTDTALTRLRQRADRVAATLGTKVGGYRDIRVSSADAQPPRPMMRVMAMSAAPAAAPPPVAEAGDAIVSITADGDIILAH